MSTKLSGDIAESHILARLVLWGKKVLVPYGEDHRYDLAVDDNGILIRVQCKSGWYKNGCILFNASSMHYHRGGGRRSYTGEIDYFGVFCQETNQCFIIPVADVPTGIPQLRVEPTKNGQNTRVRWAKDYLF